MARIGLSNQAVFGLGAELRLFCSAHLPSSQFQSALPLIEQYYRDLLEGFMQQRETMILDEQEHIRSALQQTLHRYTLQIETAAEVARTTISTLDLNDLLATAVDLIAERFELDYVGIYLAEADESVLALQAASGVVGWQRVLAGHKLAIGTASTVGRCVASRQHVISYGIDGPRAQPSDQSWLPATQSEVALPLISRDKIIGALTVQSYRPGAFSSQDVTGFQIMADQLANAIENARLYADVRQRADDLAVAYEQLKELEQLKDQFMQNISHELRTPLTMIRGYAELMASNQLGALDADQTDAVEVILRYSNALTVLVDDIMAIMDASISRVAHQPVALGKLLNTHLLDFQVLASNAGVQLSSNVTDQEPQPIVHANPDHLRRIIENLVGNAIKFTPAGGKVDVWLITRDGKATIEVRDTGIGIPEEMLPHVFDRFFQVDGSRRRRYGGVGLGLTLVKELVESYGGYVTADSLGQDRGATFRVTLPLAGNQYTPA